MLILKRGANSGKNAHFFIIDPSPLTARERGARIIDVLMITMPRLAKILIHYVIMWRGLRWP